MKTIVAINIIYSTTTIINMIAITTTTTTTTTTMIIIIILYTFVIFDLNPNIFLIDLITKSIIILLCNSMHISTHNTKYSIGAVDSRCDED